MEHFWQTLERPIIGLAPMDGVTDYPTRFIQKKYGNPDLVYTEFTSTEGVCHGATRLLRDFLYDPSERPVIAQIYGTTPDFFRQTAIILCQLGFDGIDINMGCPAKNVAHSGAGAALIETPKLAQEIVRATKEGVRQWLDGATCRNCPDITDTICLEVERRAALIPESQRPPLIPVSVKTRVGFKESVVERWTQQLLEVEPAALAFHGRTLKQQYGGKASWEEIQKAVEIAQHSDIPILGNGDVLTKEQALEKVATYGVSGVLIGRGSFGNPYVFQDANYEAQASLFAIALEHAQLYETVFDTPAFEKYSFLPMRKHLGWYVKGIPGASEIRVKIYQTNSSTEVAALFKEYGLL